jgi:hypothetical protein
MKKLFMNSRNENDKSDLNTYSSIPFKFYMHPELIYNYDEYKYVDTEPTPHIQL